MPSTTFDGLPDDARLWLFGATEPLNRTVIDQISSVVETFLEGWNAHGHPLTGAHMWIDDRFLAVAVDERTAPPSGCSIDAMVRVLKELETETGVSITGHGPVFWRSNGAILSADRPTFAAMAREGGATQETSVFDTTLQRVGELRAGRFEIPAGRSWHGKAFFR